MRRRCSAAAALLGNLLGNLLAVGGVGAQTPAAAPKLVPPAAFVTPDGTRFVLVPDPLMAQVHWAVATPANAAVEPPGLEGLAMAAAYASLGGTWRTGSRDQKREQQAVADLDQAWSDMFAAPGSAEALQQLRRCEAAAAELGDPSVFTRVLAAVPTHDPEIVAADPACILLLTTLPSAIGEVGQLLVERREEQALRELPKFWMRELIARQQAYDGNPRSALHAEVLALAMPNDPANRAAERPGRAMPRRAQALAVWQATQHPQRTVHVLLGGFDVAATKALLMRTFTTTQLPAVDAAPPLPPRPIQSLRRSTVPGMREPVVAVAWMLPEIRDPFTLLAAAKWLGGGIDSRLGQALQRAGRSRASVLCHTPWPNPASGPALLLVEVTDPAGLDGLADLVLQACRQVVEKEPAAADLQAVLTDLQRDWTTVTNDPRWLVRELARMALAWPQLTMPPTRPERIEPRAVRELLHGVFAGQPVVVEGKS